MVLRKKLIEVALPLEAINIACSHEKMPGIGAHPRGLHYWPARRPLAAARAVIFAQMVDDPSSHPDLFETPAAVEKERKRLFEIIKALVRWENTTNEMVLQAARDEILRSWKATCADNADHPQAADLFNRKVLPAFHDPFAGGGALPLEAQRLGLESYASDLNPVAVLINKAMIEIPPKFAGRPPVNPGSSRNKEDLVHQWHGAQGLAEDVRYYGKWMRDQAEHRIGHLYPRALITDEMVRERPDLKSYLNQSLPVIAWIWARTVKSPNPAFANVDVPLASTFMLSNKEGKEAYVEPVIENGGYRFRVKVGKPRDAAAAEKGTKLAGANFTCLVSGTPISGQYIKAQGMSGKMGARLMAIVAEGKRGRVYLAPNPEHEAIALTAKPNWFPVGDIAAHMTGGNCTPYGLTRWQDLFTRRQLSALVTLSDLLLDVREQVARDATAANYGNDSVPLCDGGSGSDAYAAAVSMYLTLVLDRCCDFNNTCTRWVPGNQKVMNLFNKQAVPMIWDFPEAAIINDTVGGFEPTANFIADCLVKLAAGGVGEAHQMDADANWLSRNKLISTDPPYYGNVGYADLSDFFYVWLRRSLKNDFPTLFGTISVPKDGELVASTHRHGGKVGAQKYFLKGMTGALSRLAESTHPAFPVTIYYAFKQTESDDDGASTNTGWDTFLEAVVSAGFCISGTWPLRTEQKYRMVGRGTNALASSVVLVCRKKDETAPVATRRDFVVALRNELPAALRNLQRENISPPDLAQAAIGPGMSVFTRYSSVIDANGNPVTVREALSLIDKTLSEIRAEQQGDFDVETRWALEWFEHSAFDEGDFGDAETMSRAKNTAVNGLVDAGIIKAARGKVSLLKPFDLPADWDPTVDKRLTSWEVVHHLIRANEDGGDVAAAQLVAKLGSMAESARELCYALFTICERKKMAGEALWYNSLVQSWPEITRLAREGVSAAPRQTTIDDPVQED